MSMKACIPLTAALMLSVAGTPALADLTVDDAWNTWKAQFRSLGLTLAAEETRDGDALQIGQVTLSAKLPKDAGSFSVGFAGPRFEPLGNGSVSARLPKEGQIHLSGDITGEGSMELRLDSRLVDYAIKMSGTPDQVTSEGTVGAADINLVSLTINGEPAAHARGRMEMLPYSYRNVTTIGEMVTIEGETAYAGYNMAYEFEVAEGETLTGVQSNGKAEDLSINHQLTLPADGIDPLNLHSQLRDGLRIALSGRTASNHMVETVTMNGAQISRQVSTVEDYWQSAAIGTNGLDWEGTAGAFDVDLEVAEMPLPIAVSGAMAAVRLAMPLLQAGDPQPGALALEIQGLKVNDELWAMADPAGQLPREPLQLRLDLTGDLNLSHDLVDFLTLAELDGSATPVMPVSVSLRDFFLSVVGAELSGTGAFTFDAEDTQTFPGMPRPEGAIDLKVAGLNALLDKLVAMGLVPEDQVMGARMMMGMFMVPGDAEDELKSHVEINDQGHVLANGQRLK